MIGSPVVSSFTLSRRPVATLIAALLLVLPASARAIECGDVVGPGGKIALDQDLSGCAGAGTPALTVVGPVTLDLAGYQIRCATLDSADGVEVLGSSARISNGSVRACKTYAIKLAGTGGHRVEDVSVRSSTGDGFLIESDKNSLSGVSSTNHTGAGYVVSGATASLRNCVATNDGDQGFRIESDGSKLQNNVAVNNSKEGYLVSGNGNKLSRNRASGNGNEGFELTGNGNKLKGDSADRNSQHGVTVSGDDNRMDRVDAIDNVGNGFELAAGTGNRIKASTATSNGSDGIEISANNSRVQSNRAYNLSLIHI